MKQDIEIAREATLKPISVIAATMGINQDLIEPYGKFIAKVPGKLIDEERVEKSNLILVTAITPTKAGIGKTTVSVGLSLGLARIGKELFWHSANHHSVRVSDKRVELPEEATHRCCPWIESTCISQAISMPLPRQTI